MKNLNSFKMVGRAIEYEAKRQESLLENDRVVAVETRKWNDGKSISTPMRSKEQDIDYRYFPSPDLPAIRITDAEVAHYKTKLPKLAHQYREEFTTKLKLTEYAADILTRERKVTEFYVSALKLLVKDTGNTDFLIGKVDTLYSQMALKLCNWVLNDVLALAKSLEIKITPSQLVTLIESVDEKKISKTNALVILNEIWDKPDANLDQAIKKHSGGVDTSAIEKIVADLIKNNPKAATDFATTPDKVINFFVGQTMKATGGKADSSKVKEVVIKML